MTADMPGIPASLIDTGYNSSPANFPAISVDVSKTILFCGNRHTHLSLHIFNPIRREHKLVQRHLGLLQIPQEPKLALQQKQQTLSDLSCTRRPSDSMDIIPRVVRWVILYDVVDAGDIEPSRRDVCAK